MSASTANPRFRARIARGPDDISAAQRLRGQTFPTIAVGGVDEDDFDERCHHVLIEDQANQSLVGCFRLLALESAGELDQSYSAQFYDLSKLASFPGPIVEIGRFCIAPQRQDPDILRVAWGELTRFVDAHGVTLLFGCSSFAGLEADIYQQAFALLKDRHMAPAEWAPGIKAADIFPFKEALKDQPADARAGLQVMPPLLRTYLMMGGWVSDHAVIDRQMQTLHVFTGLEINAIPEPRKRALRAAASLLDGTDRAG